jgi:putative ABC transport system substrate-binding protein
VAVLWDPSPGAAHLLAVQSSAGPLGLQTQVFEVRQPDDIEKAVASARARAQGLIALPSPMIYVNSRRIAQLTLRHRLAAIMLWQEFARAGGSMSYGPDQSSMVERSAALVASVLSGAKPADLPLERPSRFEFIVNLNTIRALGLSVPDAVLLRADHVIR